MECSLEANWLAIATGLIKPNLSLELQHKL